MVHPGTDKMLCHVSGLSKGCSTQAVANASNPKLLLLNFTQGAVTYTLVSYVLQAVASECDSDCVQQLRLAHEHKALRGNLMTSERTAELMCRGHSLDTGSGGPLVGPVRACSCASTASRSTCKRADLAVIAYRQGLTVRVVFIADGN